jgi:Xaa-Pro aminopeptidase
LTNRVQALQKSLEKGRLDGYLVSNDITILYFTGFFGGYRLLVSSDGEPVLYVYSVNYEAAKDIASNCAVELLQRGEDSDKRLASEARKLKLRNIGFDSLEFSAHNKLQKALKGNKLISASQLVWDLRRVKDTSELTCIRRAAELTDVAAKTAAEVLQPGIREYEWPPKLSTPCECEAQKALLSTQLWLQVQGPRSAMVDAQAERYRKAN